MGADITIKYIKKNNIESQSYITLCDSATAIWKIFTHTLKHKYVNLSLFQKNLCVNL